ncbi:MAG: membrane dipeptidase [Anaerolineae bacterium]|nr:membrane dipeptidase [Anaerolineae bacterium]
MSQRLIIDAHQDIAWNYFNNGRDFRRSLDEHRHRETDPVRLQRYGRCMLGLPEEIQAQVAVVCSTIFVSPDWCKMYPDERIVYDTPEEANRLGNEQLEYYRRLADQEERIHLIQTEADLDGVLATWTLDKSDDDHRLGLIVLMEGADPILEPDQLETWYERGLRIIGPAWTKTRYAGGSNAPGPLTDLGRELLAAMRSYNMILDLSHMTPEGLFEALDLYDGPLFASHANPLHFRPDRTDRNLSDEVIKLIAQRDGVVGMIPFNLFLLEGWKMGDRKDAVTMERFITTIDHVCQITSSALHVGLGSDFDGGYGSESAPVGFDSILDLQKIGDELAERGYSEADITAIMSGNFLRVLRRGLP